MSPGQWWAAALARFVPTLVLAAAPATSQRLPPSAPSGRLDDRGGSGPMTHHLRRNADLEPANASRDSILTSAAEQPFHHLTLAGEALWILCIGTRRAGKPIVDLVDHRATVDATSYP
jgi:hypothetical protein